MTTPSFLLSSEADKDFERITDYLIENVSEETALQVIERLEDAMDKLAASPEMGHLREDLAPEPLRFWYVKPHLIIYRPNSSPLEIVRVLHASRDVAAILSGEG